MSVLGSIIATGAAFIPVVGPVVSAGVGIADKMIDANKEKKVMETAAQSQRMSARQVPETPDMGTAMFGNETSDKTTVDVLGKTTYLSEKFGIGKSIFDKANNLNSQS
jgi:hypothetical protein